MKGDYERYKEYKAARDSGDIDLVQKLCRAQAYLNDQQRRYLEIAHFYGYVPKPLTGWQKRKRRMAHRWALIRRRVALWISPELDEF